MRIVSGIIRLYSLLFHFILSVFLLGIAIVSLTSGHALRLEMLPFKEPLAPWVLAGGAYGLLSVLLAALGRLRLLFVLQAAAVVGLMVRGFFLSPYVFSGASEFRAVVALFFGAVVAFLGSLMLLKRRDDRRL